MCAAITAVNLAGKRAAFLLRAQYQMGIQRQHGKGICLEHSGQAWQQGSECMRVQSRRLTSRTTRQWAFSTDPWYSQPLSCHPGSLTPGCQSCC